VYRNYSCGSVGGNHRKHFLVEHPLLHRAGREANSLGKTQDLILVRDLDLARSGPDRRGRLANLGKDSKAQQ